MRSSRTPSFVKTFFRMLDAFTIGVAGPLRQIGWVASIRPDWEAAPRTFRELAWYAGVFIACLALGFLVQQAAPSAAAVIAASHEALTAFLQFTLRQGFFVCFFAAMGRWVVMWNCIARTASPLALFGIVYVVSSIDQLMRLALHAFFQDGDALPMLLSIKDLVTIALTYLVLIDFFRPRPPKKPRKRPEDACSSQFPVGTAPAPLL